MSGEPGPTVTVLRSGDVSWQGEEVWGTIALAYRSPDSTRAAGFWSFGPGEFTYTANHDELLVVTKGEVVVTMRDTTLRLRAGESVWIPAEAEGRWEATGRVRAAFCSMSDGEPLDY